MTGVVDEQLGKYALSILIQTWLDFPLEIEFDDSDNSDSMVPGALPLHQQN